MPKIVLYLIILSAMPSAVFAQPTFKLDWNTYKVGVVVHEYTYSYSALDSIRLYLSDSAVTLATADSLVMLTTCYSPRESGTRKTATFFNKKRQTIKTEEFKDDNLVVVKEWKYDEKNRKIQYTEDNKLMGKAYKKNYDYAVDKKSGELVVTENSYYNGKVEFYTRSYYDKNSVKYKEVRLNDNNKDIIHTETYVYGENGKVRERSVYFPEFRVTKTFVESDGTQMTKCSRVIPMGVPEKASIAGKIAFIKRVLAKNQLILNDKDCPTFEYKFVNYLNCEVVVSPTKVNKGRQVIFKFKERVQ